MKKDYKKEIMDKLVKDKSLRNAVKWLNTSIAEIGKTPAELIKEGKADVALKILKR